jgi:hypothetical protein
MGTLRSVVYRDVCYVWMGRTTVMPATSSKQKHFFQMALAWKKGHKLEGLSKSTRAHLSEMASSMSEATLREFATGKVKKKKG